LEKERLTQDYLTAKLESLGNHWSQVFHYTLYRVENIDDTEYMKHDILLEAENQYLEAKSKIKSKMKS